MMEIFCNDPSSVFAVDCIKYMLLNFKKVRGLVFGQNRRVSILEGTPLTWCTAHTLLFYYLTMRWGLQQSYEIEFASRIGRIGNL